MASIPVTEELLNPPNVETDDITMVLALSLTISLKDIFIAPTTECDPSQNPPLQDSPLPDFSPQDPLFDALSPLTSINSPGSQNHGPQASPEIEIPVPCPLSRNCASQKERVVC